MSIETDVLQRPENLRHARISNPPARFAGHSIEPIEVLASSAIVDEHWASDFDYAALAGASSIIAFKLFLLGLLLFAI